MQAIPKSAKLDTVLWLIPETGIFLRCKLTAGNDAAKLTNQCLAKGMVLASSNFLAKHKMPRAL